MRRRRLPHNRGKRLVRYVGRAEYQDRSERRATLYQILFILTLTITACLGATIYGRGNSPTTVKAQDVTPRTIEVVEVREVEVTKEVEIPQENIDTWIGEAVDEFLPNSSSEARMIMHCLAFREARHGDNGKETDSHGDNGKAGGPFQFHQETWNRMRGQMISAGYATEIGSRYDFQESARTTAWALANGRGKEWGPIMRSAKGSDYATCPVPSWNE